VWAHSVRRGSPVLIPEQLGYYNITSKPGVPANRFVYDSSNGGALGGSIEEAVLGGLHEVVERDAYFATWYSRVPPCRIDTGSIDDRHSAALIARARAAGFEVHLFDMTSEARIPVVGAMIVDPSGDAKVKSYCASACEGRWSGAVFSALAEVTTSMGVYRKNDALDRDRARAMFEDHSLVTDMFDHVLLYSLDESFERLRFLLDGEVRSLQACRDRVPDTLFLDLTRELEADCAKVLEVAADIIIVDQTFAELRALGLSAAKVLVPGLLPVTFGHQYRRIDTGRLDRFARFRGLPDARFTSANLNPYPHNFP
jgi:ribosomal protein S12 methylthiotransferase accessory factor